jgi:hypothetical protein
MASPYLEVDNMFLADISDDTFLNYTEEEREEILDGLRKKAITRFKACKKDLSNRDETLKQFNEDLTDEEKLIIATVMRKFWLNDKIYNLELLKQRMSTKDWNMTSQAEHLLRLTVLNQELDKEISRMIVSYTTYAYSLPE